MQRGRRLALLTQATLVWADEIDREAFVETGKMGTEIKTLPPNPLADRIAAEIERTGRLIVDPGLFEQWKAETAAGKPLQ